MIRIYQVVLVLMGVRASFQSPISQSFTFSYSISDVVLIPYSSSLDISSSLATSTYEEIEESELELNQKFQQLVASGGQPIMYNIMFFNLSNANGSVCYYNYSSMGSLPNASQPCTQLNTNAIQDLQVDCINFANCSSENFNYSISLNDLLYRQSVIMVQNNDPSNLARQTLQLNMSTYVSVLNSNVWFYWSVALTCLLLLSLVLLTGVVLYWSLKYRKAQRALEELRLTEVDEEVQSIRKSLRKSMAKEQ